MLHRTHVLALLAAVLAASAGCDTGGPPEEPSNEATLLVACCAATPSFDDGHYVSAVWRGSRVFATGPLTSFEVSPGPPPTLDSRTRYRPLESGEVTDEAYLAIQGRYVSADRTGARLLLVGAGGGSVVAGSLRMYEPATDRARELLPESRYVSAAVFWPGHPDRVVYYQYGASVGAPVPGASHDEAGFRVLDLATGDDTPLVAHAPASARTQGVAGFDVSPDGQTLLYARVLDDGHGPVVPPDLVAFDLAGGGADTLAVGALELPGLWVRYHPDGRHVAFASFPERALTVDVPRGTVLGVLDLAARGAPLTPRLLAPTYPDRPSPASVVVMPEWAPDGRGLLVGRSPLFPGPDGGRGFASLYHVPNVL